MDPADLQRAFRATIEASVSELRVLRDILRREREALTGSDVEVLEQTVRQKTECLGQLEHSVRAREQMQQQLGLPPGLPGTEQYLRTHCAPDALDDTWRELLDLSREVGELNIHNGKLALAGERRTREALGILTGRPATPDTYSPRNPASRNTGISLGKC